MATIETVRQAVHAQPFRSFSLRLFDGTIYDVRHPDNVSIPPVRRPREVIYYLAADRDGEDYQARWLDLGLVMEVIVPTSPANSSTDAGNGPQGAGH
jgi:hypothetical protein